MKQRTLPFYLAGIIGILYLYGNSPDPTPDLVGDMQTSVIEYFENDTDQHLTPKETSELFAVIESYIERIQQECDGQVIRGFDQYDKLNVLFVIARNHQETIEHRSIVLDRDSRSQLESSVNTLANLIRDICPDL